jgi:hypothetical protein
MSDPDDGVSDGDELEVIEAYTTPFITAPL